MICSYYSVHSVLFIVPSRYSWTFGRVLWFCRFCQRSLQSSLIGSSVRYSTEQSTVEYSNQVSIISYSTFSMRLTSLHTVCNISCTLQYALLIVIYSTLLQIFNNTEKKHFKRTNKHRFSNLLPQSLIETQNCSSTSLIFQIKDL